MRSIDSIFEIDVLDYSKVGKTHTHFIPNGNKVDVPILPAIKTVFMRAKDAEKAKKRARRFGAIQSCHKVDMSYYLAKIEFIQGIDSPEPLTVQIEQEQEFVLNKAMELTNPQKKMLDQKYGIEIVDNE